MATLAFLLLACTPSPAPVGIILISLDTLRADRLGAWGSQRGLTPNLDRFAAESILFDQTYAQSNETLYSHATLFTAQYPAALAPLDGHFRIPAATTTLAGAFRAGGWQTAAFVAGGHMSAVFGLDGGFSVYDDTASFGSLRETGPLGLHWLDNRPGDLPFFLFLHAYDTHDRYLKPTPFGYAFADRRDQGLGATLARTVGASSNVVDGVWSDRLDLIELLSMARPRFARGRGIQEWDPEARALSAADIEHLAATYDGSVAWADACFGLFLAGLEERDLLDSVAIVVLSDHGEELGEAGVFHHRYSLTDATTHVPLIVRLPGGRNGGRRVTGLAELTDVAPTLLEIAGVDPLASVSGMSLMAALEGSPWEGRPVAFSEGALRLASVRGPGARLTIEGIRAENPYAAAVYAAAPVDGVSVALTGDQAELESLRSALVSFRAHPPSGAP